MLYIRITSSRFMQNHITLNLSAEQAFAYQKAILAVLAKIEVGECESIYKEHIKTVYDLLGKLNTDAFRIEKSLRTKAKKTKTT